MQKSFEGAAAGTGAIYKWAGNSEVGEGRMTITESRPHELIRINLEFLKPMTGKNNFVSKAMCLFIDMDKMLGGDFEKGLGELKSVVETAPLNDLTITRVFDAPRELVWQAWTDPEQVKRWWGPKHYTSPAAQLDFREGGKYLFCMRSPEGKNYWSTGVYQEIIEHERIVCTESFADDKGNVVPATHFSMSADFPMEMQLTITFDVREGKTQMTLHHAGVPRVMLELARAGWNESFDKMAASLEYN
jgi:uncharacterized protein YndB with AHSA1/START domain